MTSEKELRQIAAGFIRDSLDDLADEAGVERPDDLSSLDDHNLDRACALIRTWPIPDLPPADRDGIWWPERGLKYGHVRPGKEGVTISRGGSGRTSMYTSLHLTPDEAEELASLLMAAAHYERNQE
ncbi:hypothetical protein PQI66_09960 [Corynebacterium sp. USCH3]|uniref:hypothetical protein n=1 Tax=Corynebacterium sp. USCH3 TaxID=3024840 RepID=UPI0030ACD93F